MSSNIKVQRICQFCNREFTARTTVTKYCSPICAKKAYKKRKKAEKVKVSLQEVEKKERENIQELRTKDFLTITETCSLLSVSRWTIWRAIKNNELSSGKIGRRRLIRRSDIEKLFSKREPSPMEKYSKNGNQDILNNESALLNYYTVSEAQNHFGVSPSTLWKIVERESIPKIKKGKKVYIKKSAMDKIFHNSSK